MLQCKNTRRGPSRRERSSRCPTRTGRCGGRRSASSSPQTGWRSARSVSLAFFIGHELADVTWYAFVIYAVHAGKGLLSAPALPNCHRRARRLPALPRPCASRLSRSACICPGSRRPAGGGPLALAVHLPATVPHQRGDDDAREHHRADRPQHRLGPRLTELNAGRVSGVQTDRYDEEPRARSRSRRPIVLATASSLPTEVGRAGGRDLAGGASRRESPESGPRARRAAHCARGPGRTRRSPVSTTRAAHSLQ